jgi:hypothetical protein
MTTITESRGSRIIRRVAEILDELDYAQRRLLEIQTGVPGFTRRRGRRTRN